MSRVGEMTIDQLAAAVGMTVRNVRAYASRGLLPPPRLVGRKGFYDEAHASRLRLVRGLLDRGYTLGAVEKAIADNPDLADSHALDLLGLLAEPMGQAAEPEVVAAAELGRLAGLEDDPDTLARIRAELVRGGLVEDVDDGTVRLLHPALVRAGAQAIALGLAPDTVLDLFARLRADLGALAGEFVTRARAELWRPFAERGMPAEEWPATTAAIEGIIPIAVQAVLAEFRLDLTRAIQDGVAEELAQLSPAQLARLTGSAQTS